MVGGQLSVQHDPPNWSTFRLAFTADAKLWRLVGEDSEYGRIKEKVDRLTVIADRLQGRVIVKPTMYLSAYVDGPPIVANLGEQIGRGNTDKEAIAELQAKLDQQESTPTPPTPQE